MAWDVRIALADAPERAWMREWLSAAGASAEDDVGGQPPGLRARRADGAIVEIDGPLAVERGDLPEELEGAVAGARWVVDARVPAAGGAHGRALARSFALALSRRFRGAAYDPQAEAVLAPDRPPKFTAPGKEERIPLVALRWWLPLEARLASGAEAFLRAARRHLPVAVPARYGVEEPPRHRLAGGGEGFVRFWAERGAVEVPETFFWTASSPSFGGALEIPDLRERLPDGRVPPAAAPGTTPVVRLDVDLDGRALVTDPRWREASVDFLEAVAEALAAPFAAAYVQRDVIARRSTIFLDGRSEELRLPIPTTRWFGIPPAPAWLTWLGPAYAKLAPASALRRGGAALVRQSESPADASRPAPGWPAPELLARPGPGQPLQRRWMPAERIPDLKESA